MQDWPTAGVAVSVLNESSHGYRPESWDITPLLLSMTRKNAYTCHLWCVKLHPQGPCRNPGHGKTHQQSFSWSRRSTFCREGRCVGVALHSTFWSYWDQAVRHAGSNNRDTVTTVNRICCQWKQNQQHLSHVEIHARICWSLYFRLFLHLINQSGNMV